MTGRDPFANFERMRREMDEIFGDMLDRSGLSRPRASFAPPVDVFYEDGPPPRAVVVVDVSGIDPDAVSIEIEGRELTLRGQREAARSAGRLYQQLEIATGPFERRLHLGADVVVDSARAVYEDGMLRIELPLKTGNEARRTVHVEAKRPKP